MKQTVNHGPDHRRRRPQSRSGSVLVEFAMVSFLLYLLLVVLLDLGRATLAAQTIQEAATVLANELARAPLGASVSFEDAMADPWVNSVIYSPQALVLPLSGGETQVEIEAMFAQLPIVNQILRPLMIRDQLPGGGAALRFPGALVQTPQGMTVLIPQVVAHAWSGDFTGGYESIQMRGVMEEVFDPATEADGHFAIDSGSVLSGVVNVRCNYPYQAAAMTGYYKGPGAFGLKHAVLADDTQVTGAGGGEPDLPPGFSFAGGDQGGASSPYGGKYGLGSHYVGQTEGTGRKVRPYRRLLSAQGAARREVIVPE